MKTKPRTLPKSGRVLLSASTIVVAAGRQFKLLDAVPACCHPCIPQDDDQCRACQRMLEKVSEK